MAAYLAMRILQGKQSYEKVIALYPQYKEEIDEILRRNGWVHP